MLLIRVYLEPDYGRRVEVGKENQRLILLMVPLQVIDEAGGPRSLPLQPVHLIGCIVRILENPVRVPIEVVDISRLRVGRTAAR